MDRQQRRLDDPRTKMWIVLLPRRVRGCVRFREPLHPGGINERGCSSTPTLCNPGWKLTRPSRFSRIVRKQIGDYILAHCASVADATTFFKTYSVFLNGASL